MALRLSLENESNLSDGGPVSFTVRGKRTVDIGRDQHLDWTLPDPTRFVSGKHCEIRYNNGAYWLHDVSTNGTFLNGAEQRMREPHLLRSGDRFIVGHYIVAVTDDSVEGGRAQRPDEVSPTTDAPYQELWANESDVPPPIDPKQLKPVPASHRSSEFLDWAASVPAADPIYPLESRPEAAPARNDDPWGGAPVLRDQPVQRTAPVPAGPAPSPHVPPASNDAWDADTAARDLPQSQPSSPFLQARPVPAEAPAPIPVPDQIRISNEPSVSPARNEQHFSRRLAEAAGLPANFFETANQDEAAAQLGAVLKIAVEGMMRLLQARNQAKQITRSSHHTMIQAVENNPLKFSPSAEEAMRIMLGPKTRSYLDARAAFSQSFDDLTSHQLNTYVALQHAVTKLLEGLDPETIESEVTSGKGKKSLWSSRTDRLWNTYRSRWDANLLRGSGGPIAAFMLHFATRYDDKNNSGK